MTNAERLMVAIDAAPAGRLAEEIDLLLDAWADDPEAAGMTRADAFWDVSTAARRDGDRRLASVCDGVLLAAGFLRPRPAGEEIATTGRDRAVIRGGVRCDPAASWEEWIAR